MALGPTKYTYNADTARYEVHKASLGRRIGDAGVYVVIGVVIFLVYTFLNNHFFHLPDLGHLIQIKHNRELIEKIEYINQRTDYQVVRLADLQMRDNKVYRPIFGMDEIPASTRNAGYGSEERYAPMQEFTNASFLTSSLKLQDIVAKKTYIQSLSFDEIEKLSSRADNLAASVPNLFPVCPGREIAISSPFGYRLHPVTGEVALHTGYDISGPKGTPIYATADGTVTDVKYLFGAYGNVVEIDHGFGYSTRYAHLYSTNVAKGQAVKRGDQIATMGASGRATGPHLHYEVLYMGAQVNPWNFFDKDIDPKVYKTLVRSADKVAH